jgi:heavy metal sensor kinase
MSIRLRLTLAYVVLLGVILGIFGVGLYTIISNSLYDDVNQRLTSRAQEVQASVDAAVEVQQDPLILLRQGGYLIPKADVFSTGDIYVQIMNSDGTVISRSDNLGLQRLPMDPATVRQVMQGQNVMTTLRAGQTRLQVLAAPLRVRDRVIAILLVAQSLREVDVTLARLTLFIGGSIAIALVLAFGLGAFLASNALTPMDRVTKTARSISRSGDLGRRLEQPRTLDEVGRLAQTFNEMLARIEGLFRAQQRFVADVSHELRSPLTAIRGNLDLLERGAADDPAARQEALGAMDVEVQHMSRLVADLLTLARADAGVPIEKQPVELDTILLDVYRHARLTAQGVTISIANEDQVTVQGDPDRLKQLFLNLTDNALKYTPAGGRVTLAWERADGWVRVAVADTGIGIAPENLPHLFERFYRADKARSREQGGTGLGLAIAKWIAEAHGGKILVESQVGKGSTFTVLLPLAKQ